MDFSRVWIDTLSELLSFGTEVSPRGMKTREIPQRTIEVDMRKPVLCVPERKLSYQFMAAEAYWILSGDDRVASIAPWNKRIADFSDDGVTFFGAYGPKIVAQLPYVIEKLKADEHSRQAGLTIWRESPPPTKDVPCTVAVFFGIRNGKLNVHVFMRSSDAWLGVPYDVFNFSMLGHLVCAELNQWYIHDVLPGTLYLTAASSHIYEANWKGAVECISGTILDQHETPESLWTQPSALFVTLGRLRDSSPGDPARWW